MSTTLYILFSCIGAAFFIGLVIVARELIKGVPEFDEDEQPVKVFEQEYSHN